MLDRWGMVEGTANGADTLLRPRREPWRFWTPRGLIVDSDYEYGSFTVDRLPAGTYYAKFVFDEWLNEGYQDELYDNVPCEPSCDLSPRHAVHGDAQRDGHRAGFRPRRAAPRTPTNHLVGTTFFGSGTERACEKLTADNGTTVATGADVTFQAGRSIVLGDGFQVESGASFRAVIEPSWTSDQ